MWSFTYFAPSITLLTQLKQYVRKTEYMEDTAFIMEKYWNLS